jgi:hypothetical protein
MIKLMQKSLISDNLSDNLNKIEIKNEHLNIIEKEQKSEYEEPKATGFSKTMKMEQDV